MTANRATLSSAASARMPKSLKDGETDWVCAMSRQDTLPMNASGV